MPKKKSISLKKQPPPIVPVVRVQRKHGIAAIHIIEKGVIIARIVVDLRNIEIEYPGGIVKGAHVSCPQLMSFLKDSIIKSFKS